MAQPPQPPQQSGEDNIQEQQIGFQAGSDDDDMPPEMRDHMLAAFAHKAGLGPHPGMYQGPPRKKRDRDEPTDTDMQRAAEEPIGEEASAAKMRAARTGGSPDLGPSQSDQQLAKQQQVLQNQAAARSAQQATKAQASQSAGGAPPAPSGPQGVTQPYPAQSGPQPPPAAAASPPEAPGAEPPQEEAQGG